MFRLFFFLSFFLGINLNFFSQNQYIEKRSIGKGFYSKYGISSIKEDQNRQLWISTFNGVVRYDGNTYSKVETFGSIRDILVQLHQDSEGKFHIQDLLGRLFYIHKDSLKPHFFNDQISKIHHRGPYWVTVDIKENYYSIRSDEKKLIKVDNLTQEVSYPLEEKGIKVHGIYIIIRPGQRPIIVQGKDSSLGANAKRHIRVYNEEYELLNELEASNIQGAVYPFQYTILANGNYLVSGYDQLFECNSNGLLKKYDSLKSITGLLSDTKGGLWVSTDSGLLYYPDGKIESESGITSLKNTFCVVHEEDFQGGVWIYTRKDRMLYVPSAHISHFHDGNYLNDNHIGAKATYLDTLFYGHDGRRLYYLDQKNKDTGSYEIPLFLNSNKDFLDIEVKEKERKMWISQRGRLSYRKNGVWDSIYTGQLDDIDPFSIYNLESSDNKQFDFIGFHDKQYFLGVEDSIHYVSNQLPEKVTTLVVLRDSVIIGTTHGLYLQTKRRGHFKKISQLLGRIIDLVYFDSKIWGLSSSGLFVLDSNGAKKITWMGKSIPGNELSKQGEKYLWLLRKSMSFRYKPSGKKEIKLEPFQGITAFPDGPIFNDEKSLFLQNVQKGILKIDFDNLTKDTIKPLVFIKEIRIDENVASLKDTSFNLEHTTDYLRISYAAADYSESPIQYRYKFGSTDNKWKYTYDTYILLVDLPPATYNYEIQARYDYHSLEWGATKRLQFRISPPWWTTWWFISLEILMIALIVFSLVRLRFRQINQRNALVVENLLVEQQALRAKLDPHYVFNIISSAQLLILKEKKEKAITFLQLFSRQLRSVLEQTDKKLQPLKDELSLLKDYIELERFRLGESFNYHIHLDPSIETDHEGILSMLIQPFAENAIQHGLRTKEGKVGELNITIVTDNDFLKIIIDDNGIGRAAASKLKRQNIDKKKSHGVEICRKRLRIHNADSTVEEVQVLDKSNQDISTGTQVTLLMKRIRL